MTPLETLRHGANKFFRSRPYGDPPNLCICPREFADALREEIDARNIPWVADEKPLGRPAMIVDGVSILTSPDAVRPIFAYSDEFPPA